MPRNILALLHVKNNKSTCKNKIDTQLKTYIINNTSDPKESKHSHFKLKRSQYKYRMIYRKIC